MAVEDERRTVAIAERADDAEAAGRAAPPSRSDGAPRSDAKSMSQMSTSRPSDAETRRHPFLRRRFVAAEARDRDERRQIGQQSLAIDAFEDRRFSAVSMAALYVPIRRQRTRRRPRPYMLNN